MQLPQQSHKRLNILTGEWVLVSPHRNKRPWQGKEEKVNLNEKLSYDTNCYLCPGNERAGGLVNPKYSTTFVFENDFAALSKDIPSVRTNGLLRAESEEGICKVICYSPDHSLTMANMDINAIENVIEVWQSEYELLGKLDNINYVQIFENKGETMGCSNPHPHGQIWAQQSITNEVIKKDDQQKIHYIKTESSLLSDYLFQEMLLEERIIYENDHFVVLVPFWAIWPFETMIIPKTWQQNIAEMNYLQINSFANALKVLTKAYDQIFDTSFPYSNGIHQSPTNKKNNVYWHWHMSFYPPLLRSATIKKFMVGYEMFGMPQRDITPEIAAERLRALLSE